MDGTNYTDKGYTPVQVGQMLPPADDIHPERDTAEAEPAGHVNVREWNATVGIQVDHIGGLDIRR